MIKCAFYSNHQPPNLPTTNMPATTFSATINTRDTRNKPKRGPNAKWCDAEIRSMLLQLRQAQHEGNTSENGFNGAVFETISQSFSDPAKNKRSCETKFHRLKKDYKEVKYLRESQGFVWDERSFLVTAAPLTWDMLGRVSIF